MGASELHLDEIGLGKYVNLRITGHFNLTIRIPENRNVQITLLNNTSLFNQTFQNATVQINLRNDREACVLLKSPTVTVDGDAFFHRARLYRNYYKKPLFYDDGTDPFKVIGTAKFKIAYSDGGLAFLEKFSFSGKGFRTRTPELAKPFFTEGEILWVNVLISRSHLLLVVTTFILAMRYFTSKRLKIVIRPGKIVRRAQYEDE